MYRLPYLNPPVRLVCWESREVSGRAETGSGSKTDSVTGEN